MASIDIDGKSTGNIWNMKNHPRESKKNNKTKTIMKIVERTSNTSHASTKCKGSRINCVEVKKTKGKTKHVNGTLGEARRILTGNQCRIQESQRNK